MRAALISTQPFFRVELWIETITKHLAKKQNNAKEGLAIREPFSVDVG